MKFHWTVLIVCNCIICTVQQACTEDFVTEETWTTMNKQVLSNRLIIFPNIKFICGGYIVNWAFSGMFEGTPNDLFELPELQVWRNRDDHYRLRERSTYNNIHLPIVQDHELNKVWFTPKQPLDVDENEVLGLLLRSIDYSNSSVQLYFEDSDLAAEYHYYITPSNPTLDDDTYYKASGTIGREYIPLITVEFIPEDRINDYFSIITMTVSGTTVTTKSAYQSTTVTTKSAHQSITVTTKSIYQNITLTTKSAHQSSSDNSIVIETSTSYVNRETQTIMDKDNSTIIANSTPVVTSTANEQGEKSSVNYWMIATIILIFTFVMFMAIYITTVIILLRKLKKTLTATERYNSTNENQNQINNINEASIQFRINSREKRMGVPESMCSNDAYNNMKNPIETDELPYQELDYNHVYASPFKRIENIEIDSGSCDHYVQNPAYQIGSYQSESNNFRLMQVAKFY